MKNTQHFVKTILLALVLSLGVSYAYAWTAPTLPPPGGNVAAPLNTSGTGQIKAGGLMVGNTPGLLYGLLVPNGNVGIGTPTPTAKLEVAGQIKIADGTQGVGKLFTSDANGVGAWVSPALASTSQAQITNLLTVGSTTPSAVGTVQVTIGTVGPVTNRLTYGTDGTGKEFSISKNQAGTVTDEITVRDDGDVGIGVPPTANKLEVGGNVSVPAGFAYMYGGWPIVRAQIALANNFFGNAGNLTMTGTNNTATGQNTFLANTTGTNNTANGSGALQNNTTGSSNTANGMQALVSNTTGANNTAIGFNALAANTIGINNTANGVNALASNTADNNTAVGQSALGANTTGMRNVAVGITALASNTSGSINTAVGDRALFMNTTGAWNTVSGSGAMGGNTIGTANTASGVNVLGSNTSGWANTAFGVNALIVNTTGGQNTAVGHGAGGSTSTGSLNTALGESAGPGFGMGALSNTTAIGANAVVTASNSVRIGDITVTSIGGQVGWSVFSDKRLKKNIRESDLGLDFIMKLKPVIYNYIAKGQEGIEYTGLIAQDVEQTLKELGTTFSGLIKPQNEKSFYELRYAEFVTPLIKAVQEQQKEIADLKETNKRLEARLEALEAKIK